MTTLFYRNFRLLILAILIILVSENSQIREIASFHGVTVAMTG